MKTITRKILLPTAALIVGLCSAAAASSEVIRVRAEVDRPVFPANKTERIIIKVGLDGVRRANSERLPVNLALVIDRSSSMHGDKIVQAREAALELVERLNPDDVVSLIAYNGSVDVLVPACRVGDGRELSRQIRKIQPSGMTNIHGAVNEAAVQLRQRIEENYAHRVILLSDGQANVGPSSPQDLGRLGAALMREGISVTTVGLGLGYNEDLMTLLARRSDGNTYFVEHSADLRRIFDQEMGDALDVIAKRVEIVIQFPKGVKPLRVVGRDGRIEGGKALVEMNQLYGGQEKFILVEAELSSNEASDELVKVAEVDVRYHDTGNVSRKVQASTGVRFSKDEQEVIRLANHQVQTDYAENRIAEVRDEAVVLVNKGDRVAAAKIMDGVGEELRASGAAYGNKDLDSLSETITMDAFSVKEQGLNNEDKKRYRASSYQTTNQQKSSSK